MSDWTLPGEAFEFLEERMLTDATIVELGSGEGTRRLASMFSVVSIEHDRRFIGKHPAAYIHAPIVDGWYDTHAVKAGLPADYDCIVIDGPPGNVGRLGMLEALDLFKKVPVLLDDVHRPEEQRLLMGLVEAWGHTSFSVHHLKGGRAFATFGWGNL